MESRANQTFQQMEAISRYIAVTGGYYLTKCQRHIICTLAKDAFDPAKEPGLSRKELNKMCSCEADTIRSSVRALVSLNLAQEVNVPDDYRKSIVTLSDKTRLDVIKAVEI